MDLLRVPAPDRRRTDRGPVRFWYLTASSTDPAAVRQVAERARGVDTVLVVLDCDHRHDHVLAELHAYAPLVTAGSYLVVEDTNVNDHPIYEEFGPGPTEGSRRVQRRPDQGKFFFTFSPRGWLRKVR